ncbi:MULTISPECIES: protein translocase subunit SecF [Psychrobacter]|jgi:preprotein translocase subunit SecF|uniref:protein translocase subunit SecF n=1 Tax=Psychrobacter TaxID=497 RepID=UPI000289C63F|nr:MULTISPECIES: protein translocase subunit SecF [Psychrobacter]MBF4488499.1 protein translocase subunit SecF [Psychrobacter sp. N25K4-3-2]MBP3944884.1 protein translocase subunit SecF [Psychrobacter sp. K31L]MCH1782151.1 protein translocase subunit SecF [Psychrobacter glaciei]
MAIDKNNPLEQQNNPDRNGSNGDSNSNSTRRRNKPRRDGKGSNTKTNNPTTAKSDKSKTRRGGQNAQELTTQTSTPVDQTQLMSDAAEDAAAQAEGGIKAVGNQRIIPFMKIEKPMAILSLLMVIGSIIAIAVNGLNLGLDFTGGVSADVRYEQPAEQVEVVKALADNGFDDAVVQYLGTRQELLVRLPPQSDNIDGLNASLSAALALPNNTVEISNVNIIGSQVGNEVYLNSVMSLVLALVCMLGYVALRFQFKLSLGAVLSLFHDAIVTIGVFALFGFPFDLTVLAAILALIGYSLNDTIVVYDRIRENFRRVRGITPRQTIDLSLTETLRRTIMTISTVLLVVLAMLFLGGDGLYWFSVALFIGLLAGTYSSTYIASSIPLRMGLSRDDFVVKVKPEFEEEIVTFNDPKMFEQDNI